MNPAMATASLQRGGRSRKGCESCKRSKKRCGEEQPKCFRCVRKRLECVYPHQKPFGGRFKFQVMCNADHIPPRKSRTTVYYYVNFTVGDVSVLCPDYVSSETTRRSHSPVGVLQSTSNACQSWENQFVPEPFLRLLKLFPFLRPEENQLLDYYSHVICKARVFQDSAQNNYRSLILPLCQIEGPLLSAVLAIAANDRHNSWALQYKSDAIKQLRSRLGRAESLESCILACITLCSLEIADGSRSSWITHARGAAAILESYTHTIDTHVADFATRYLRPRSIFLNTTTAADQQGKESSAVGRLANPLPTSHPLHIDAVATVAAIDPHIGCSLEVLDIIAQTADLASLKWSSTDQPKPSHFADPTITHRAAGLLARLNSLQQPSSTYNDNDNDDDNYVRSCAESFRLAALIYLRHVAGFDYADPFRSSSSSSSSSSASSPSSSSPSAAASTRTTQLRADLRRFFTLYTTRIVRRGMPRVLFPVWPLFVAGCFAEEDAFASASAAATVGGGGGGSVGKGGGSYYSERAVVMDVFATLEETWPVSNVPVVRAAVETVWKERDLSVGRGRRGSGGDAGGGKVRAAAWKRAIEALGWKLALS